MKYIHATNCGTERGQVCSCLKARGYLAEKAMPVGTLVTLYEDFESHHYEKCMHPGDVGIVRGYSNMGFNGIVAYVKVGDTEFHVSAGKLVRADDGGENHRRAVEDEYRRRIARVHDAAVYALKWADENGLDPEMIRDLQTR